LGELLVNVVLPCDSPDLLDPLDPVDKTDPVDPADPADPAGPAGPADPADPAGPAGRCGECGRCMESCPAGAIVEPRVVDANRCASYLTVEHRGELDETQKRYLIRNRRDGRLPAPVFGCDICQDVCPWNQQAPATKRPEFQPRERALNPLTSDLKALTEDKFQRRFAGSCLQRCGYEGFRRNLKAITEP